MAFRVRPLQFVQRRSVGSLIVRVPKVKSRRFYDVETYGRTYLESDRDFLDNNVRAAVWFLENRDKIADLLKCHVASGRSNSFDRNRWGV